MITNSPHQYPNIEISINQNCTGQKKRTLIYDTMKRTTNFYEF